MARCEGPFRDIQLHIESPHLKIRARDLADETRHDGTAPPFTCEEHRSRGFGRATKLSPKVQFPPRRRGHLELAGLAGRQTQRFGEAFAPGAGSGVGRRKLIGPHDAELPLGLKNSRRRDPKVEVLLKCRADQATQLIVLKDVPPRFGGER